jgi:hypothetical protein
MNIEDKIYKRLVEDYGLDNLKMTIGFDDNDYAPIVIFSRYSRVVNLHVEMMEHLISAYDLEKDICDLVNLELTRNCYE